MCLKLKPTAQWQTPPSPVATQAGNSYVMASPQAISTRPDAGNKPQKGSLRQKLWELPSNAHCPIVGVCLSMQRLQSLLGKAGHQVVQMSQYEQHLVAVGECRRHSRLAEIVQKALDEQYQLMIASYKSIDAEPQLRARWLQAKETGHWAADFWTILTHPRVSSYLTDEILGDVHMLQHQVGVASRQDQQQAIALQNRHDADQQQLTQLRERMHLQQQESAQRLQALNHALVDSQSRLAHAEKSLIHQNEKIRQWELLNVEQLQMTRLQEENASLREKVVLLEKSLRRSCNQSISSACTADAQVAAPISSTKKPDLPWHWLQTPQALSGMSCIACVGGAASHVSQYRAAVEQTGVDFVHHDGGVEHKLARLERCLSQADLVICQTGCVSHNAYWRVKEHCKRTGKPCVFVENPSPQTLKQFMQALPQSADSIQHCRGFEFQQEGDS